jgi:tetratricopeptide (TPR) repeat protein
MGIDDRDRFELVNATIDRALEIDPDLGEAYATRGINNCFLGWNLNAAETDYRRALELSPRDPTTMHWYAELLAMLGRFDESLEMYERALAADPLSMPIRTDLALTYYYFRDFDKALELLTKASQVDPAYARTYEFLHFAYREKEMYPEAIAASRKRIEISHKSGDFSATRMREVVEHLDEMERSLQNGSRDFWLGTAMNGEAEPYNMAVAFAKLGEKDKAFDYLERAFMNRYTGMVWLKVSPEVDNLRDDPRFANLLQRIGLS